MRESDNSGELFGPLSINFTDEADTRQLTDHAQYAGQLSSFLGSETQACFCLPQWNEIRTSLTYKPFICLVYAWLPLRTRSISWFDCTYSLESARDIFANKYFPDRSSAWLEGRAQKCCHLKAFEANSRETGCKLEQIV